MAPSWFSDCWRSWQNVSKEKSILENRREQKQEEKKFMKEEEEKVMEEEEKNVEEKNFMEREGAKEEIKDNKSKSEKWEKVEAKVNTGNQVTGKVAKEEEKER